MAKTWEDTVTSACKLCSSANDQAVISFKAGKLEASKVNAQAYYDSGKQAGIKEVVEWIKNNATDAIVVKDSDTPQQMTIRAIPDDKWQIKLKDWGIKMMKRELE